MGSRFMCVHLCREEKNNIKKLFYDNINLWLYSVTAEVFGSYTLPVVFPLSELFVLKKEEVLYLED